MICSSAHCRGKNGQNFKGNRTQLSEYSGPYLANKTSDMNFAPLEKKSRPEWCLCRIPELNGAGVHLPLKRIIMQVRNGEIPSLGGILLCQLFAVGIDTICFLF